MRYWLWLPLLLCGCAAQGGRYNSQVDAMFRETGGGEGVLTLTRPALVNEVNGAYQLNSVSYQTRRQLSGDGVIEPGAHAVLAIEFTDFGDISVLRTDDKDVSLRAELGPQGKVVKALLGSERGKVSDGFVAFADDTFKEGTWKLLYDGPDLVVGRLDLKFAKYEVAVNFRAARK